MYRIVFTGHWPNQIYWFRKEYLAPRLSNIAAKTNIILTLELLALYGVERIFLYSGISRHSFLSSSTCTRNILVDVNNPDLAALYCDFDFALWAHCPGWCVIWPKIPRLFHIILIRRVAELPHSIQVGYRRNANGWIWVRHSQCLWAICPSAERDFIAATFVKDVSKPSRGIIICRFQPQLVLLQKTLVEYLRAGWEICIRSGFMGNRQTDSWTIGWKKSWGWQRPVKSLQREAPTWCWKHYQPCLVMCMTWLKTKAQQVSYICSYRPRI